MTVIVAFKCRAQDLFGLDLRAQLPQLFSIGEHQLRLLTLSRRQLLPGAIERLQANGAVLFLMRRQGQIPAPGATLQFGQFRGWQNFVLAQFRQQADERRPVAPLLMQALQLTQGLGVMRVTLVHRLQGRQGSVGIAAIGL
ncbi:hypothetical protein D3C85_981790 [compost metagenome]